MARVIGLGLIIALWILRWRHGVVFLRLVVRPLFHPLPGPTHFLWQDKESESAPAGGETEANHQRQNQKPKNQAASATGCRCFR